MDTAEAPDGARLGEDIILDPVNPIPFARRGLALSERSRTALLRAGRDRIYVDDELGEGIEILGPLTIATRQGAAVKVAEALNAAKFALNFGGSVRADLVDGLMEIADRIAGEINVSDDAVRVFTDLTASGGYLIQHSVDVCALGLALASRYMREFGWGDADGRRRYDASRPHLGRLGLGLLLHDIGKTVLPAHILHKPGRLDAEEWAAMQTHPVKGAGLLPYEVSFVAKAVVRSHHERWDGTGYPDGQEGRRIPISARIAAVADVFDAITAQRVHRPAAPVHVAYDVIVEGAGTLFDPDVVEIFRKVVAPYPPGTAVLLEDGREAVVSKVDMSDPARPTVRVPSAETGTVETLPRCEIAGPARVASAPAAS